MASATGELILRKLVMSSGALTSGQGENLNKVLTMSVRNDWRMVNAPAHSRGVSFAPRRAGKRGLARRSADWQKGNFDATFGLCQP